MLAQQILPTGLVKQLQDQALYLGFPQVFRDFLKRKGALPLDVLRIRRGLGGAVRSMAITPSLLSAPLEALENEMKWEQTFSQGEAYGFVEHCCRVLILIRQAMQAQFPTEDIQKALRGAAIEVKSEQAEALYPVWET